MAKADPEFMVISLSSILVQDKTLKTKAGKGFIGITNSLMKPYGSGYATTANFAAPFGMARGTLKLSSNEWH